MERYLTLTGAAQAIAYIKVTSGAGTTVKYYAVTITRQPRHIAFGNFETDCNRGSGGHDYEHPAQDNGFGYGGRLHYLHHWGGSATRHAEK